MKKELTFEEYSMWVQKKYEYDWYDWCVFVSGDEEVMSGIRQVKYTLHESFPDPVRTTENRENCFALYSAGWGGFAIGVNVTFADGSTDDTSYFLKLLNKWPRGEAPSSLGGEEKSVYETLLHEKFRWRKISTILKHTGLPEVRVLDVLRGLEAGNVVRKAYFKSVDNQEMWGATVVVGLAPRPSQLPEG